MDASFRKWVLEDDPMTNLFWEKWLKDNPEKKADVAIAQKMIRQLTFKDYQASQQEFNEVWDSLKAKQTKGYSDAGLSGNKWYMVAAAASIVMLIAAGVWFIRTYTTGLRGESTVIVNNQIKTGTDKATLTLEDGSRIVLEKGRSYHTKKATSNGEQIIYQASDENSEEIVYNYLTIPRGGQFFIKLADGTQVWLNSDSRLKYPVRFTGGESREVELIYGEAYFDVSPAVNHGGAGFRVIHKMQEIEVLGTQFNVTAYTDENKVYTTLVEGKVAVQAGALNEVLEPGEQAALSSIAGAIDVASVDVFNETSWKEGVFSFEGKSLKDIMKVLSRWYDMEVVFDNKALEDVRFIGILGREQKIEEILSTIRETGFINGYSINEKKVILK